MFGDVATGTPDPGFGLSGDGMRVVRISWRPGPAAFANPGFEASFAATRMEPGNDSQAVHGAPLRWNCQLVRVRSPSLRPCLFEFAFALNPDRRG